MNKDFFLPLLDTANRLLQEFFACFTCRRFYNDWCHLVSIIVSTSSYPPLFALYTSGICLFSFQLHLQSADNIILLIYYDLYLVYTYSSGAAGL